MKKIGIITLYDKANYGNRLQNFAVHQILEKKGLNAETIVWERSRLRHFLHPIANLIMRYIKKDPLAYRIHSFQVFNQKYIPKRFIYSRNFTVPSGFKKEYDYFLTGSDQVWNIYFYIPNYFYKELNYYFLQFADDNQKICLSPGIGVSHYKNEHKKIIEEALKGYKYLCCRENQGVYEIEQITGRECEWLIDPTLFLTSEEWEAALPIKHEKADPYVFVFFIDGMSEELNHFVKEYAANQYCIIDPSDKTSKLYGINPAEFISLLSNAHMVFTDSFHVMAFCVNFHIPFYVFNRNKVKNMSARIESICEIFSLHSRYILEQKPFSIEEKCDFDTADKKLITERKKFSEYLDKCFQL